MSKSKNPWNVAARQPLARGNYDQDPKPVDPGARFFVRMLEKLGCKTEWSCEGHPAGFSIVFHGPDRIAREIVGTGIFAVRVWRHGGWNMTIEREDLNNARRKRWTEKHRRKTLRLAANLWVCTFGDLDEGYPESLTVAPRDRTAETLRQLAMAADCFLNDMSDDDNKVNLICAMMDGYHALAIDPQVLNADPQTLTT